MRRLVAAGAVFATLAVVPAAGAWSWPVDGPILRPFSLADSPYAAGQHRGLDIGAEVGARVVAPAAGTVTWAGSIPHGGRALTIATSDGLAVTLLQLGSVSALAGTVVAEGDAVGVVGPSADPVTTSSHVHLGIRVAADPNGYLDPVGLLPARLPAPVPAPEPLVPVVAPVAEAAPVAGPPALPPVASAPLPAPGSAPLPAPTPLPAPAPAPVPAPVPVDAPAGAPAEQPLVPPLEASPAAVPVAAPAAPAPGSAATAAPAPAAPAATVTEPPADPAAPPAETVGEATAAVPAPIAVGPGPRPDRATLSAAVPALQQDVGGAALPRAEPSSRLGCRGARAWSATARHGPHRRPGVGTSHTEAPVAPGVGPTGVGPTSVGPTGACDPRRPHSRAGALPGHGEARSRAEPRGAASRSARSRALARRSALGERRGRPGPARACAYHPER